MTQKDGKKRRGEGGLDQKRAKEANIENWGSRNFVELIGFRREGTHGKGAVRFGRGLATKEKIEGKAGGAQQDCA